MYYFFCITFFSIVHVFYFFVEAYSFISILSNNHSQGVPINSHMFIFIYFD